MAKRSHLSSRKLETHLQLWLSEEEEEVIPQSNVNIIKENL
jgi:hypothetical protein